MDIFWYVFFAIVAARIAEWLCVSIVRYIFLKLEQHRDMRDIEKRMRNE